MAAISLLGMVNQKTEYKRKVGFILEGGEEEKRKYHTPTALTATNSAQFTYVLCILLVCYSLTEMHSYHSSCIFIFPDGWGGRGGGTQTEGKTTKKERETRTEEEKEKKRKNPKKLLVLKPPKQKGMCEYKYTHSVFNSKKEEK